jgi:hypothetical protein
VKDQRPDKGQDVLPSIFQLRGITPGGEPVRPETPKYVEKVTNQVPPSSYLAQTYATNGEPDPGGLDSSDSDTTSGDSSLSQQERKRKAAKHK